MAADIGTWVEQIFVIPVLILLPLMPVAWPAVWVGANQYVA